MKNVCLTNLKKYDRVLILTDHSDVDYARVVAESQLVVNTRNATRSVKSGENRLVLTLEKSSFVACFTAEKELCVQAFSNIGAH